MSASSPKPIVSETLVDGTVIEMLYDRRGGTTALATAKGDGTIVVAPDLETPDGTRAVPYSPSNNLLATGCVLFPSEVGDQRTTNELIGAVRAYLSRYVDLSPGFLEVAPYYVFLSWSYDRFQEVPLMRFRGALGCGKTRGLIALGSICYKPFFASGASTVSPIFHILDSFRGTLVLDEADFRYSDLTGELVKVLNNGTVNGLPVLRTMSNRHRELNPQAFRVFGPKILAMRESFSDAALESRCLTEEMVRRPLPSHIPIHTPERLREEAQQLRNELLTWRLRHWHAIEPHGDRAMPGIDPRTNQMALALLSLVEDEGERKRVAAWLRKHSDTWQRGLLETPDALMVRALINAFDECSGPHVHVAAVTMRYNDLALARGGTAMSNKWVGAAIRRLGLPTVKSSGVYGISKTEHARVAALGDRLGIARVVTADPSPVTTTTESLVSSGDVEASSMEERHH